MLFWKTADFYDLTASAFISTSLQIIHPVIRMASIAVINLLIAF